MQTWLAQLRNIMEWPAARFGHATVSLYDPDKDPEHPALVLVGGCSHCDIHNDAWLLSVNNLEWRKVRKFEPIG